MIEATYGDIVPILGPLIKLLEGMADGAESLAGSGVPMADSPAMAEMSKEASIAGDDFEEPVHAAPTNASILRFAATDYVRQFAAMFRGQPVPVYAHLPVARASLEAAALASYWAGVRGIGPTYASPALPGNSVAQQSGAEAQSDTRIQATGSGQHGSDPATVSESRMGGHRQREEDRRRRAGAARFWRPD